MYIKNLVLYSFISLLVLGCNPKVTTTLQTSYTPIRNTENVIVLQIEDETPESAITVGEVKIGDSGFTTNCSYDVVIERAKMAARKAGGNVIQITEHKKPNMGSTCHRISANILKVEDIDEILAVTNVEEEVLEDVEYAILNVYRYSGMGNLVSYDLYLEDSLICRVKNNFKTTIHIKKEGLGLL